MNSKIKKILIVTCSSVVLFLAVFYMTRSLNNLIEGSDKENIISLENTSSDDNASNQDTEKETKENNKAEETKTTNTLVFEDYMDYTVQEGDTLFSIARNNMPWKGQEEAANILATVNNLKDREVLSVGSKLRIPVNNVDTANSMKYIVKEGESLYTIAEEYLPDMNVMEAIDLIMEKNNITNPSALSIGLEIYIPGTETSAASSETVETSSETITNEAAEEYVQDYIDDYLDVYSEDTDNE